MAQTQPLSQSRQPGHGLWAHYNRHQCCQGTWRHIGLWCSGYERKQADENSVHYEAQLVSTSNHPGNLGKLKLSLHWIHFLLSEEQWTFTELPLLCSLNRPTKIKVIPRTSSFNLSLQKKQEPLSSVALRSYTGSRGPSALSLTAHLLSCQQATWVSSPFPLLQFCDFIL